MLGDMAKKGLFTYAGRTNQADGKFSGRRVRDGHHQRRRAGRHHQGGQDRLVELSFLPYHDDVKGAPQNSIIGGASLWVMGGKKAEEYKGVAKFFAFLSQPEIQMDWHTSTGYVPITKAVLRADAQVRLLRQEPGRRHAGASS